MNDSRVLGPGVRRLTVNIDSEDVSLFEDLWPVPHGVSLHAYLVQGSRAVLVDPWDAGGYGPEEIGVDLGELGLTWKDIAAVAHTAPRSERRDQWLAFQPDLEFWGPPAPGAHHDLGGVSLVERDGFWMVPEAGVVFSGDAYSGLGWVEDELWAEDLEEDAARWFEDEALRWFASRPVVPAALPEGTKVVAPAHGLAWGKDPAAVLERARRFEAWGKGAALAEAVVVWPWGAERDAEMDALVGGILDAGWGLHLFRMPGDDPTALAAAVRRSSLVVAASGLETSFLHGVEKPVWIPRETAPSALRTEVAQRIRELS